MKRSGPLLDRLALRALRMGAVAWGAAERVGLDIAGASEGPPVVADASRRAAFDELIAAALAGDGAVDAGACRYPLHELLTHLVIEHGLLLHGSNDPSLTVLRPRPARDFRTELHAVVACNDGIWPIFYAVVARNRVDGIFTACLHVGRVPRLRRLYLFAIGGDPAAAESWTNGVVYALPREGFRREWGREWVRGEAVLPVLRVPVTPEDFPLRETVIAAPPEFRGLGASFRAAKRRRAARAA
jgi:hypothetical protein